MSQATQIKIIIVVGDIAYAYNNYNILFKYISTFLTYEDHTILWIT